MLNKKNDKCSEPKNLSTQKTGNEPVELSGNFLTATNKIHFSTNTYNFWLLPVIIKKPRDKIMSIIFKETTE